MCFKIVCQVGREVICGDPDPLTPLVNSALIKATNKKRHDIGTKEKSNEFCLIKRKMFQNWNLLNYQEISGASVNRTCDLKIWEIGIREFRIRDFSRMGTIYSPI